ncbi:MAG: iron ABC transporter permease [Rhodovarius sp.]|nr:iron ABC transporter permease [Acetobacteraceae bacterium]MDW8314305.1 iron ABC transporter permease [Rhodovarius sp.]
MSEAVIAPHARSAARLLPRTGRAVGLGLLALLLLTVCVFAIGTGAIPLSPRQICAALLAPLGLAETAANDAAIVWTLRMPRTLLAVLVGAVLGLAGAVMQGLFRNPLADPGLLGVSAGGALGAVAAIVLGLPLLPEALRPPAVAIAAFAGALIATLLVLRVATTEGRISIPMMLLGGVATNALAGAATGFLIFAADDLQLRDILFWTMGSVAGAAAPGLSVTLAAALPLVLLMGWLARALNALILGEAEALHLGIPVEAAKWMAVGTVALAVGAAVAASGTIGFVGLVAPHLVRLLGGADHRWVLPASGLVGAALLVAADVVARIAVVPAELPIGLVTALIGGPFFLALLRGRRAGIASR